MNKGNCIHYTGTQHDCCKAGVIYGDLVDRNSSGWAMRLPCWTSTMAHAAKFVKVECMKYADPTDTEIAADAAETAAFMVRMRLVMSVVSVWRKKPPKGKQEVIECPACKGRLHLSQSSYNGHVHGNCETEGCVRWME